MGHPNHAAFDGRPVLDYDAPGCGETRCAELAQISGPFLMQTALAVIEVIGFDGFHFVGRSMGGLTALMLAGAIPGRVLSFVDIEGKRTSEDCFLSLHIFDHPRRDVDRFFYEFIERTPHARFYASALCGKPAARGSRRRGAGIFESMVHLSDHDRLTEKFLCPPCPKLFMYREPNASLSCPNDIG